MTRTSRVLMLGPSLDTRGGIASVERLMLTHAARSGWAITHVPTIAEGGAAKSAGAFARAVGRLVASGLADRPDVVHIHFSKRGSALRKGVLVLTAQAMGLPVVLHAHASEFREFYAGLSAPARRLVAAVLGRADRLVSLSESWRAFYQEQFRLAPGVAAVLPNAVAAPARVPDRAGRAAFTIAFLGRIGDRKGTFELLRAVAALPEPLRARTRLVVAGDGEGDRATALAAELGLERHVEVRSWISPEERDALLAEADLFALPSRNEGLPMSMLEAMGWGVPVVVTPVGGIPELIRHGENGWLVEPGDVAGLAAALETLLTDEPRRLALGAAARQAVAPMGIDAYMARLAALWAEVAARPSAAPCAEANA